MKVYIGKVHFKEIPEEDVDMYTAYVLAKDEEHALQLLASWAQEEKNKVDCKEDIWLEVRDKEDFPDVLVKASLEDVEPVPCETVVTPKGYDILLPKK